MPIPPCKNHVVIDSVVDDENRGVLCTEVTLDACAFSAGS